MVKPIICPNCGVVITKNPDKEYTTMRISLDFVERLKTKKIDSTYEDTLRRLLGWPSLGVNEKC